MKIIPASVDLNIFYVFLLFGSCLFLLSVFDIYYDKKKNLWNLRGPFPFPFVGQTNLLTI